MASKKQSAIGSQKKNQQQSADRRPAKVNGQGQAVVKLQMALTGNWKVNNFLRKESESLLIETEVGGVEKLIATNHTMYSQEHPKSRLVFWSDSEVASFS